MENHSFAPKCDPLPSGPVRSLLGAISRPIAVYVLPTIIWQSSYQFHRLIGSLWYQLSKQCSRYHQSRHFQECCYCLGCLILKYYLSSSSHKTNERTSKNNSINPIPTGIPPPRRCSPQDRGRSLRHRIHHGPFLHRAGDIA